MIKKLVKGVVYTDNLEEFKYDVFERISNNITNEDYINYFDRMAKDVSDKEGIPFENVKQYFYNMEAIASITRYNDESDITHNLIIPKETLSSDLVDQLESVDLAKDMLNNYSRYFIDTCIDYKIDEGYDDEFIVIPKNSPLGKQIYNVIKGR